MSSAAASRTFEVRHVQLARAAFAALAAIMITFSPDHSAVVRAIGPSAVHRLSFQALCYETKEAVA